MAKRMMNLGDVKVGTCYVSALRGKVVSIVRVAHTDAEKRAMFGSKYKKTRTNDAPMWEAIGNDDGKKHIAGSADDLHKLEFVPKTDRRWFDPNALNDKTAAANNCRPCADALASADSYISAMEKAGVWGASTLRRDFDQLTANFASIRSRYRV